MRLKLLGSFELVDDNGDVVLVATRKRRDVLVALALELNQVVSVEALLATAWGVNPPRHARSALQGHIAALRKQLDASFQLITRVPGYQLSAPAEAVDVQVFQQLVDRSASATPSMTVDLLRQALSLWRGPALAGLTGDRLELAAAALEESRLTALETLADELVRVGRGPDILAALHRAGVDNPLRESLISCLMLALYQDGRQAEAFSLFYRSRERLAEELGVDPSPTLRAAHDAILHGTATGMHGRQTGAELTTPTPQAVVGLVAAVPVLDRGSAAEHARGARRLPAGGTPATTSSPVPGSPPAAQSMTATATDGPTVAPPPLGRSTGVEVAAPEPDSHATPHRRLLSASQRSSGVPTAPAQLPAAGQGFCGRTASLSILDILGRSVDSPRVAIVVGDAGTGKTALALHWAHQSAVRYPDGQLFANLHGFSAEPSARPEAVLAAFLRALGLPAADLPPGLDERAALYRSMMAHRRTLVLLDNAGSIEQVRPLLPATATCTVVVTSRRRLDSLVAIDGALPLTLAALSTEDAHALLAAALGTERLNAEPHAVRRLTELCDRLPLALRIIVARLATQPHESIASAVKQLDGEHDRLAGLRTLDRATSVSGALELTYRGLPKHAAALMRGLGLHPGTEPDTYAAMVLTGLSPDRVHRAFDALEACHLVSRIPGSRYRRSNLVRIYSRQLAIRHIAEPARATATTGLLEYFLLALRRCAETVNRAVGTGLEQAGVASVRAACAEQHLPEFSTRQEALAWFQQDEPTIRALIGTADQSGQGRIARSILEQASELYPLIEPGPRWIMACVTALPGAQDDDDVAGEIRVLELYAAALAHRGQHEEARSVLGRSAMLARSADNGTSEAEQDVAETQPPNPSAPQARTSRSDAPPSAASTI